MNTDTYHPSLSSEEQAIRHLKTSIASGKHWYIAMLEAINMWQVTEETVKSRHYKYLIDSEAFDWLLLAERLCRAVDELLPQDEKQALIFNGEPPLDLKAGEFKELIGGWKYQQYLNFFYGITLEEVLLQVAEEEVRKERSFNCGNEESIAEEAHRRIYGYTQHELLNMFQTGKRLSAKAFHNLDV
jgi:hypothetical protein